MKRILLITSVYTGAGHKSISDSLIDQFSAMPDVEVQVIDGFELMGGLGVPSSKIYGFMTRHAPFVHNAAWRFTMAHPMGGSGEAILCSRRLLKCIRVFHPDLIFTVHSLFNAAVTRILKRHGLHIPVLVLQADLINIHSSWCNPDADMTICPTREAYDASLRQGMLPEKLQIIGFPVRGRFTERAGETDDRDYDASRPLRCLLMSGGEGSGVLRAYAEAILEHTDAAVTIVCGRNTKLCDQLKETLGPRYGERVRVLGFVSAVEQEMLQSDLLITRGSPNTMLEAVMMNVPLIMTGPMLEQEKDNPRLLEQYDLGVISGSPGDAPRIIRELLADHAARHREIRAAQRDFRSPDDARKIAAFAAELAQPLNYTL